MDINREQQKGREEEIEHKQSVHDEIKPPGIEIIEGRQRGTPFKIWVKVILTDEGNFNYEGKKSLRVNDKLINISNKPIINSDGGRVLWEGLIDRGETVKAVYGVPWLSIEVIFHTQKHNMSGRAKPTKIRGQGD